MRRYRRDENGMAMVTSILVSTVVLALAVVAIQVADHNLEASSADRQRIVSVQAAEAGLDDAVRVIQRTPAHSLPCTVVRTLDGARFVVDVKYYSVWPPGPADLPMACGAGGVGVSSLPAGALLTSAANIVRTPRAERTMQSGMRLTPIFGAFRQAIFSNSGIDIVNNFNLTGQSGNDADVYTNGNFRCANSPVISGSVFAQGTVTMENGCIVRQDVWGNGNVSHLASTTIGNNATSSTGSISITHVSGKVGKNARAGTTCNGCAGKVGGTITTSSPQGPPREYAFPQINYDQAAYVAAGFTNIQHLDCATAAGWIEANSSSLPANTVVRVAACPTGVSWSNLKLKLNKDLAIIVDGPIKFGNKTEFSSNPSGSKRNLHVIVPYNPNFSTCSTALPYDITAENLAKFNGVATFVYSPCRVSWQNHAADASGQLFAGVVEIANQFTMAFNPIVIPGSGEATGFNTDIAYKREIANS